MRTKHMAPPVAIAALALCAFAASAEPDFSDYPATGVMRGEAVHPDYTADAAMYRTRIRRGVEAGPNAAGHYSIISIGCGVSCTVVEMVDLLDGSLLNFPVGGEDYYQLALGFRRDSRLIVADWKDPSDGQFRTCVRRFYEIVDGDFVLLEETSRAVEDYAICSE